MKDLKSYWKVFLRLKQLQRLCIIHTYCHHKINSRSKVKQSSCLLQEAFSRESAKRAVSFLLLLCS